ncbi:MAG: thiamine-binding protein [Bacteroidota bacterium]
MNNHKINLAIQLLPTKYSGDKIALIDKAIACIQASGLSYLVCPFETVVEGTYDEIFKLVNDIRTTTLNNGCEELLINMKMHAGNKDLHFQDKLEKYS